MSQPQDPREALLLDCIDAVRARGATYNRPSAHFTVTAALINAYFHDGLPKRLRPHEWPMMMILDKIARTRGKLDHRDSWVDIAGYAACAWDVIAEAQEAPEHNGGTDADGTKL